MADQILEMARELGEAIQQDERFIRVQMAQAAADADEALQGYIGEFNLKRIALNNESQKEEKDEQKLEQLNSELRAAYANIMKNASMTAYNESKPALDLLINQVARIIMLSAQGEDPQSIDEHEGCSGSCSTCGGCH